MHKRVIFMLQAKVIVINKTEAGNILQLSELAHRRRPDFTFLQLRELKRKWRHFPAVDLFNLWHCFIISCSAPEWKNMFPRLLRAATRNG
jgi:hypothetical protein